MERSTTRRAPPTDVAALFSDRASVHPEHCFLRAGKLEYTYARIEDDARALAAAWQDVGVERGDRIVLNLPNCPEAIISFLAAARIGAFVVPVNPQSSERELRFVLRSTEAVVAVTVETLGETDFLQTFERLLPGLPALQYVATVGQEDLWYDDRIFQFEDLVSAGQSLSFTAPELVGADGAAILYTAGTSYKQKGAILTHANLLFAGERMASALSLTSADRTLCAVPLFNIFGLGATLLPTIVSGGCIVLLESFDAAAALEIVEDESCTVLHGVPTMFVLMQRELETGFRPDVSSLRTGIIAGAPVRPELVEWLRRNLVPGLEIAYGLTETTAAVTITAPGSGAARSESVGRPLAGVDVGILDADEKAREPGRVGDIAVKGPNVMRGYFRQPSATRAAFTADGFLRTGDLGKFDSAGNLRIVGRESDLINRGGYAVHPREIEDHLRSHPAVDEAVVVGVPNDVLGELICACIVPVEGALVSDTEIMEHCRPALAEYKLPDIVRFIESIPRSDGGSPRRAELVRAMRAHVAVASGEEVP